MRLNVFSTTTGLTAAALALGVVGVTTPTAVAEDPTTDETPVYVKREEQSTEIVTVLDDDDDDDSDATATRSDSATNSGTGTNVGDGTAGTITYQVGQSGTGTGTNTGSSKSTNDYTKSGFTAVSRDGEPSRGDKTKDFTRDGGSRTRDITPNLTNDTSRNDTRR